MDDYCGCCGRLINRGDHGNVWCKRCKAHVVPGGMTEDATYFAQHGRQCPWQIGTWDTPKAEPHA